MIFTQRLITQRRDCERSHCCQGLLRSHPIVPLPCNLHVIEHLGRISLIPARLFDHLLKYHHETFKAIVLCFHKYKICSSAAMFPPFDLYGFTIVIRSGKTNHTFGNTCKILYKISDIITSRGRLDVPVLRNHLQA